MTFEETSRTQGTEIILDYDKFMSAFGGNEATIDTFINKNFVDCSIPISVVSFKDGNTITRPVELKKIESFYPQCIRLDNYFDGMEVVAQFSYKGIQYLRIFSDIYGSESLIYREKDGCLIKEENFSSPVLLKEYLQDGVIKYLRVPIIASSEEDKFIKAYEVLDDFGEALEKIDYENANIITHDTSLYNYSELLEYGSNYVVDNYSLSEFRSEVGHSQKAPTYGYLEEKNVIEGHGEKLLSYVKDKFFGGEYQFQCTDLLYIKNVLISSTHLKIPFLAEGVVLKGLVVNVVGKNIVPNVSRNNISEMQIRALSYAVGKAIHLWICNEGNLEKEEKSLMQAFINKCYADKSEYLKD